MFDRKKYMQEYRLSHQKDIGKYRLSHQEERKAYNKGWVSSHPEKAKAGKKKWRLEHPLELKAYNEKYYLAHLKKAKAYAKKHYLKYPDEAKAYEKKYRLTNPEKVKEIQRKHKAKRRNFGFIPLNEYFLGAEGHHINFNYIIYIPKKLHRSIWHSLTLGISMKQINKKAFNFMKAEKLKGKRRIRLRDWREGQEKGGIDEG